MEDDALCVAKIELLAFNRTSFSVFWVVLFHTHFEFWSGSTERIVVAYRRKKKYQFMNIPDLHVGVLGLVPSMYSLFPLSDSMLLQSSVAEQFEVIHRLACLLSHPRQSLQMEDSQHPRRRTRSSNGSQGQITGLGLTTPPDNPPEKPREVATGFTEIYGALSPRKAALISSLEVPPLHKMGLLILSTGIGSAIGTGLMVGSGRTLAMYVLRCYRYCKC